MKSFLIYVKGNDASEHCKEIAEKSLQKYGWDYEPIAGITPKTLDETEFPYSDIKGGRLEGFAENEPRKYPIKKSCVFNNLRHATRVIDAGEPMIFLEHDIEVIDKCEIPFFEDYLFLSFDYAFKKPSILADKSWAHWQRSYTPPLQQAYQFPPQYPLRYYHDNRWSNAHMTPGTSAYALTPYGAEKLLRAAEKHGLDQSDYIYNSKVMKLQALNPSIVKLQKTNPNLTHKGS